MMIDREKDYEVTGARVQVNDSTQSVLITSTIKQDGTQYDLYLSSDKLSEGQVWWEILYLVQKTGDNTVELGKASIYFDEKCQSFFNIELTLDWMNKDTPKFVKAFLRFSDKDELEPLEIDKKQLELILKTSENEDMFRKVREIRENSHTSRFHNPSVLVQPYDRRIIISVEDDNRVGHGYNILDFNGPLDPLEIEETLQRACDKIYEVGKERGRCQAKEELRDWLAMSNARVIRG